MSDYRISVGGDPGSALRASIAGQVEQATERLTSELDEDPVEAIHGARKNIKKSRSALRLGRGELGDDVYAQENATLREASALLSAARDAHVMLATLTELEPGLVGRVPEASVTALREQLTDQGTGERSDAGGSGVGEARALLDGVIERSTTWPLRGMDTAAIAAGLARGYGRGRRERARSLRDPSAERLHEWRKRAKDLWYHQRLIRDAWPQLLKSAAEQAHELTELLGDDHDLWVLREALTAPEGAARAGDRRRTAARGRRPASQRAAGRGLRARRAHLRRAAKAFAGASRPTWRLGRRSRRKLHPRDDLRLEVERKFVVPGSPPEAAAGETEAVRPGLSRPRRETEVRVRRIGDRHLLTVKSGGGLRRAEEELELRPERFAALWALTEGRRVEKVRRRVALDSGLVAEVDVYGGDLEGLVTAEVEFPDVRTARCVHATRLAGPRGHRRCAVRQPLAGGRRPPTGSLSRAGGGGA